MLNLQVTVKALKSYASIKELTLKRIHGVQQYVFYLVIALVARKILAKRLGFHFNVSENLKKNWGNVFLKLDKEDT